MTLRNTLTLILNGGWTAEAEVSRNSGKACLKAAREEGWNAELLEVDRSLPEHLIALKPARVFNALHGQMGEDGNIQGLLNLMDIPYTHSGLLASSIAMDKLVHGDGGCQQPAMGVGNIHQVEQALNIAVFAHLAMQGVEHPCGLERDQVFGQGTVNLQQLGVPAFFPGGLEARLA